MPWYMWYILCGLVTLGIEVIFIVLANRILASNGKSVRVNETNLLAWMFEILLWPISICFIIHGIIRGLFKAFSVYMTTKRMNK